MPSHGQVIWSVFKRNFSTYFLNPTGYVFITVFILLGAIAAFWQTGFFLNNLANLDQLNAFFPILLLFFVPAIAMNVWSEERRQGTDELLFTLPVRDVDIVIGKYLAVLGIYTVAIVFSLSHVVILMWLGSPDLGLMAATYLGYWLIGAALLAVGMVASLLTTNATVAFLLGAGFCAFFVFIDQVQLLFGGTGSDLARALGVTPHFRNFGNGLVSFGDVAYFVVLTAVMLYLNVVLLRRRHERGGEHVSIHAVHGVIRTVALAVVGVAACVFLGRTGWSMDVTAENLHSLQPQTRALLDEIPDDRPVFIQAFLSPQVPQSVVETRKNLINLLKTMDAVGGDRVRLVVHDTEPYTETAAEAAENYNIEPRPVVEIEASQRSSKEIFMGLVFTSGPEEFVIPFFDRGLPVEYELARSIRVVSRTERPVHIQAFLSPQVPEQYAETRKNLITLLEGLEAGNDRLQVTIRDTEPNSEAADAAAEQYGIEPRRVAQTETGSSEDASLQIFMGLGLSSGPEKRVIPFVDPDLPIEDELETSIRMVSRERKVLGVVGTDAGLFGGFDFQMMTNRPNWSFVTELEKQYEVRQVPPAGPYPDDVDVLLVALPSSMAQPEMDTLRQAILAGTPTLLLDDPLPLFNPQLAPPMPKDAGRNPFMNQGRPPAPPKGDVSGLLRSVGIQWRPNNILWSAINPHPTIADVQEEILFIVPADDNPEPFNPDAAIVSGLQEVVAMYAGAIFQEIDIDRASLEHTPLLRIGALSGETQFGDVVERGMFGIQLVRNPRRVQSDRGYVLAMRVKGQVPDLMAAPPADGDADDMPLHDVDVILVGDLDLVSETFFQLRRQGFGDFNFDNVTFALNAIDVLAGDASFVDLRKHRPQHRTLERVEARAQRFREQRRQEEDGAETKAAEQMAEAQTRLDEKVQTLRDRTDLDEQTKGIMLRTLENAENRRLEVVRAGIDQEKERHVARAEADMATGVAGIQRGIKWWAAVLPPIPPLILAIALFVQRYRRERASVSEPQLAGAAT